MTMTSVEQHAGRIAFLDKAGKRSFCLKCGTRVWTIYESCGGCYIGPIDEHWRKHGRPGKECGEPSKVGEDPIALLTHLDLCKYCGADILWRHGIAEALFFSEGWDLKPFQRHACHGTVARAWRAHRIKEGALTLLCVAGGLSFWFGVAAVAPGLRRGVDWLMGLIP